MLSKPFGWEDLPSDLLREVFEVIEGTSSRQEFREFLYQVLFVCKSWSTSASYRLYEIVDLTLDVIPDFAYTIRTKPNIGPLVKSIKIHLDTDDTKTVFPPHLDHYLKILLRSCPNLKAFGSSSSNFEPLVTWRLLDAAEKAHHKNIRCITMMDERIPTSYQYISLCFKFMDSLTKLHLCPALLPNYHISESTNCRELKDRIYEFKSLTQVQICGNSIADNAIITEVDELVNYYLCKISSLELNKCKFRGDHDYTGQMYPSRNIKKLQLTNCQVSTLALQYFGTKFQGMEKFVMIANCNFAMVDVPNNSITWWDELANVCRKAQHYELTFQKPSMKFTNCAKLSSELAQGTTELTIVFDRQIGSSKGYAINMKHNGSFIRLFDLNEVSHGFINAVDVTQIFQALQPCSPAVIKALDVNNELRPERILHYLKQVSQEMNTKQVQKTHKKFWNIFNGVMSLIDGKTGSMVHLDKMTFFRSGLGKQTTSFETSISELKLTNCVFYYNVFLNLSARLPKVDKLIISKCIFMSNSIYQINIDLPETELGHLELNLNSIFDSVCIFLPKTHTLAVTVGDITRNYVYIEDEHQKFYQKTDKGPEKLPKTPADFHISIKCKKLQTLSVSWVNVF
ncbi:hypothetical protein [Parasitella parasitica]|uniref:Uncharacterized protein n=1 Tax=Parasitella parasitica TaxID=35722 RepID=A0A0B7MVV7_9FUNG|nr:hypothetical protein [Parasitella parasitica]